jgi:hypothetical protein
MAEIRSTLDMVMERAARLAAEAPDVPADEALKEDGMRLAVSYLGGEAPDLLQLLEQQPPEKQSAIRSGMAIALLRNIILPRDQTLSDQTLQSFKGLQELSGNAADIMSICSELQQILEQYARHQEQVRQQFDESILNQLKMQLQQQGMQVDDDMALSPTMHPHYKEEWARVSADLNSQYNQALDQRKQLIAQRFAV